MSGIGLGRLGSTSPDLGASSCDNHTLLDIVDREEGIIRGRNYYKVISVAADLI